MTDEKNVAPAKNERVAERVKERSEKKAATSSTN